jgi:hypothetical protein
MIRMNDVGLIETLPNEANDLALHVQLCEQRYVQIISKLDHVDERLNKIETALADIKETIGNKETATYEKYIKWGGAIIFVLTTTLVGLVTHLLFK